MSISEQVGILLPKGLQPVNTLEEYKSLGGLKGIVKARQMPRLNVIAEIKKSGLRGRGGAGFPVGVKWESVNADPWEIKYVVCNSAEGEPGTYKDRFLIRKNPFQLFEGILIAAYAIGAKGAFVAIKKKFKGELERLTLALAELEKAGVVEKGFIEIVPGPNDYLFGEEKALIEVVDGGLAMPRIFPPYVQGVRFTPTSYNPTLVNNVESMSHVAHIMAHGADWFRSRGTQDTPGTMIFTLSGDVKRPGLYEQPMGITLRQLIYEIGGGPVGKHPIRAVFSGVANSVITPDQFDIPLDFGSMRKAGTGVGSGGFIVYDETMCMAKVALMFSRFLAEESCGQCVPCKTGGRNITEHLEKIETNRGRQEDLDAIFDEAGRITSQTRCFLPAQESVLTTSIILKFKEEFRAHLQHPCWYGREPVLPKLEWFDEKTGQFTLETPSVARK